MATADTTTVRVRQPDSARLRELADARQTTVIEVVHAAIDALERQDFLQGLNADYGRLRDSGRWDEYKADLAEWDQLKVNGE